MMPVDGGSTNWYCHSKCIPRDTNVTCSSRTSQKVWRTDGRMDGQIDSREVIAYVSACRRKWHRKLLETRILQRYVVILVIVAKAYKKICAMFMEVWSVSHLWQLHDGKRKDRMLIVTEHPLNVTLPKYGKGDLDVVKYDARLMVRQLERMIVISPASVKNEAIYCFTTNHGLIKGVAIEIFTVFIWRV